jgi:hypothetical protein
MNNLEKLTSSYVRAWCEEWAVNADTTQRMLEVYARATDDGEVIEYLSAIASARRFQLRRAGRLITLEDFLEERRALPADTEIDWNVEMADHIRRLF